MCLCVFLSVGIISHRSGTLHRMADDSNDMSSEVLEDSCCRTLQQLSIRAECCGEGNVDAARNMASAEAGGSGVKDFIFEQVLSPSGTNNKKCTINPLLT